MKTRREKITNIDVDEYEITLCKFDLLYEERIEHYSDLIPIVKKDELRGIVFNKVGEEVQLDEEALENENHFLSTQFIMLSFW